MYIVSVTSFFSFFFFQEIDDSLKNLQSYPVHFNLLIEDLIFISGLTWIPRSESIVIIFYTLTKIHKPTPVGLVDL